LVKESVGLLSPYITKLFNRCLSEGVFPVKFKQAIIIPVPKKNASPTLGADGYRPISNLCYLSKLLERVVNTQIRAHLDKFSLLSPLQSAYRPFFSTETAILKICSDIMVAADRGQLTLLGLFDLSAAFDCVDHSILLDSLQASAGLTGTALAWFSSYLGARSARVSWNGTMSHFIDLEHGVPQGSVLGPLLFLIYTIGIDDIFRRYDFQAPMYADDIQAYTHCLPAEQSSAVLRFQKCSSDLLDHMSSRRLRLNPGKTEFMWLGSPNNLKKVSEHNINLFGSLVHESFTVRNLGVIIDPSVTFAQHISRVCRTCFFQLKNLRRIRRCLSKSSAVLLIHAFVSCQLDYCNSILYGLPAVQTRKLQSVLNSAARLVSGSSIREHIKPQLKSLHWLSYPHRITFKVCLLTYRCLHSMAPKYLSSGLQPVAAISSRASLRSSASGHLVVPRARTKHFGSRSFSFSAPTEWNSLPKNLHDSNISLPKFKSALKTYLFCS
jgi:hypothetical protein